MGKMGELDFFYNYIGTEMPEAVVFGKKGMGAISDAEKQHSELLKSGLNPRKITKMVESGETLIEESNESDSGIDALISVRGELSRIFYPKLENFNHSDNECYEEEVESFNEHLDAAMEILSQNIKIIKLRVEIRDEFDQINNVLSQIRGYRYFFDINMPPALKEEIESLAYRIQALKLERKMIVMFELSQIKNIVKDSPANNPFSSLSFEQILSSLFTENGEN